jgi:hypothetical protein
MLIVVLLLLFPLVQGLCSSSTQSSDAAQCALGILTNLDPAAAVAASLGDLVACVMDGTTTQCHLECTVGFLTADCVGEVYETCIDNQAHKCMSACSGGINIVNQGCFNAALDVGSLIPGIKGVVLLAAIFFNCVDIVDCGLEWVLNVIFNAVWNLSEDAKAEFCSLLRNLTGQIPLLSGLLSFYKC